MAELKLPFAFSPALDKIPSNQLQANFDTLRQFIQDVNDKVEAFDDLVVTNTFTNTGKLITDSSGNITTPLNPAFVVSTAGVANFFGDGNIYTIPFDTEAFDRGGDYNNSTYTFTAPVTGLYSFITNVNVDITLAGTPTPIIEIVTTSATYSMSLPQKGSNTFGGLNITYAPMTANDTAYFTLFGDEMGGGKTSDLGASYAAGFLIG